MEKWDLYDKDLNIIGEHERGNELKEDTYHLVVHVWIKNSKGEYLIAKRADDRPTDPGMWECVGGSVLKGESSLDGAVREVHEELGITDIKNIKLVQSIARNHYHDIVHVYIAYYDGEVDLNNATTKEVSEVEWVDFWKIKRLMESNKFINTLAYFFSLILSV